MSFDPNNLQETIAEFQKQGAQFFQTLLEQQQRQQGAYTQFQILAELYGEFIRSLLKDPAKLAELQATYWQDYWQLCTQTFQNWTMNDAPGSIEAAIQDKRFRDKAWDEHPYFKFIKELYHLNARHITSAIANAEDLDEDSRQKIEFFARQLIDALAPSNFALLNPEVMRKTAETQGKNLLLGLKNLIKDLKDSDGNLKISMTDLTAFEVGRNLATTEGKVIFENKLFQLIQYKSTTEKVYERPFLMIPPWINKYYILDLSEKNSFVKWLVEQGFTVCMISWVNPDESLRNIDLEDYLTDGVLKALEFICKTFKVESVNALGFCIGGTLLGASLAYLAKKKDSRIHSATYLTTLLDFDNPGDMMAFVDEKQIAFLEKLMAEKGYLDGGQMSMTFNALRANDLIWSYYVKNYLLGEDPFPFDLLYWNSDSTNMPAKMHSTYLRGMYLNNLLAQPDGMTLDGVSLDLRDIQVPAFFLSTEHDHIAPWQSTYQGALLHSGETEFVLGGSGHIAGVINPPNKQKYDYRTAKQIAKTPEAWYNASEANPGSWWPYFGKWLEKHSGEKVSSREYPTKTLEDAPGSYVKRRLY